MRSHALIASALALLGACHHAPASRSTPRGTGLGLAVLISVDQLRADLPLRMLDRFGEGGFRRLYREGVVYDNARYAHSATETAVGHATLATGALPRDHGIVGNDWVEHGARVYSVDDRTRELLGAAGDGKSPWKLLAETVGDVAREARPSTLVRGVSQKERSAILLAGRGGVAYWLDDTVGAFVTSRYYVERLPAWVEAFTSDRPAESLRQREWSLSADERTYTAPDDRPHERGESLGGVRFPHSFGSLVGDRFVHALRTTPFSDELTVSFVTRMLAEEPIGRDDIPDLLFVGLSASDYIGHAFGLESREAEDNLLRLDRTLAGLFALLDERVGKRRYFVVLTADHGGCETPEWFREQGTDAGRLEPEALKSALDAGLRERFGVGVELVLDFVNPTVVLHESRIASLSLDLTSVERAAAEIALGVAGVHAAYARSDIVAGTLPQSPFKARIENSVHAERSGHVYIVPKEHWLLATNPKPLAAMHGTPWDYDIHVPIIVSGTGAPAQRVARAVDPRDVAPTIAKLLGIRALRSASGQVLNESIPPTRPPGWPSAP